MPFDPFSSDKNKKTRFLRAEMDFYIPSCTMEVLDLAERCMGLQIANVELNSVIEFGGQLTAVHCEVKTALRIWSGLVCTATI